MDFLNTFSFATFFTAAKIESIVRLALVLIIGLPIVFFLSRTVKKYSVKKFSAQQSMILGKFVLYTGIAFILFSALREVGFELTTLLGAAGIATLAIGFASQTSVSNIISGLFLLAEKPFEVNDIITVGTNTGVVLSIDFLSVKLRTFDNQYIRIPNETIIKTDVINMTHFPIRRVDINLNIVYRENIGRVRQALLDVADKNALCLKEPEPFVYFNEFGDSSYELILWVWAEKSNWLKLKNSIAEDIKNRFEKENIEIAFRHLSLYAGSMSRPFPVQVYGQEDTGQPGGQEKPAGA
ncbi:MAG: mechanosensitive ion channel family protein [Candidatus Zhuqueibacterota bacterium]